MLQNRVIQLRQEQGLTQEELGKQVGVTRQTIIAIEKGNYVPSLLLAINIAKFFQTPLESIFYESLEK